MSFAVVATQKGLLSAGLEHEKGVLTVKATTKWYSLHRIYRSLGRVHSKAVSFGELDYFTFPGESAYRDHAPNPNVVARMAAAKDWVLDPLAAEVIVGRWALESFLETPEWCSSIYGDILYPPLRQGDRVYLVTTPGANPTPDQEAEWAEAEKMGRVDYDDRGTFWLDSDRNTKRPGHPIIIWDDGDHIDVADEQGRCVDHNFRVMRMDIADAIRRGVER